MLSHPGAPKKGNFKNFIRSPSDRGILNISKNEEKDGVFWSRKRPSLDIRWCWDVRKRVIGRILAHRFPCGMLDIIFLSLLISSFSKKVRTHLGRRDLKLGSLEWMGPLKH